MQVRVDDLFAASRKVAFTRTSCLVYLLPPIACFYAMAVLVQLKGTQYYRLALLPLAVWLSWRGAFIDLSEGVPAKRRLNSVLISYMLGLVMRGLTLAAAEAPYRRLRNGGESRVGDVFWSACDLLFSTRGIGWNWAQGPAPPKPVLQTESRIAFVLFSAAQAALHVLCSDVCIQTLHMLSPDMFNGGSLFDHTLPPLLELARAVLVAFLSLCMVYFGLQRTYKLLSIVGVVLFQQTPSQWPPLFDSPWLSTSLTELWGRRWHQILRESVVTFGYRPFRCAFGQIGGLLGAFFVSGVIHDIELRGLGNGGNAYVILGFWLMNGVGVASERVWKKATGRRVSGVCGWVWMIGWLALWGVPMVDTWAKTGRFGSQLIPGCKPSLVLVAFVRRCLGGSS